MNIPEIQKYREDNGTLPAYAWPGGYPIYYVLADGETLCPACANRENGSIAVTSPPHGIVDASGDVIGEYGDAARAALVCARLNRLRLRWGTLPATVEVQFADEQWLIIGSDIHYEGAPIQCAHCYAAIESAYGDPAQSEEKAP